MKRINLPIDIKYIKNNDTALSYNGFKVQILQNKKGKLLSDAFVWINNDTTSCLPSMGTCTGEYKTIDSVKVVFENGYCSKWIKLTEKKYNQLLLTVQVDFKIASYISFKNERWKLFKKFLRPVAQ